MSSNVIGSGNRFKGSITQMNGQTTSGKLSMSSKSKTKVESGKKRKRGDDKKSKRSHVTQARHHHIVNLQIGGTEIVMLGNTIYIHCRKDIKVNVTHKSDDASSSSRSE